MSWWGYVAPEYTAGSTPWRGIVVPVLLRSRRMQRAANPLDTKKHHAILISSMNRTLTTFLVWLMMAVLPLHAVAAAANMSCVPPIEPVQIVVMSGHGSHLAADDMHAHHGGQMAAAASADAGDDADPAKAEKSVHSSCSACSAFCAGAVAPPSFSLPLPAVDGSEPVIVSRADIVAGFIPDGLQRPPRQ